MANAKAGRPPDEAPPPPAFENSPRPLLKSFAAICRGESNSADIRTREPGVYRNKPAVVFSEDEVTRPPKSTIYQINKICSVFFWGDSQNAKKIHWTTWDKMTDAKGNGGLEFRNLFEVMLDFAGKQYWKLRNSGSIWTEYMKKKYIKGRNIHYVPHKQLDSQSWKQIRNMARVIDKETFWMLGKGDVYFWTDHWFGGAALEHFMVPNTSLNDKVSEFWLNESWDLSKLNQYLPGHLVEQIKGVQFRRCRADKAIWKPSADGLFTVKSFRKSRIDTGISSQVYSSIWHPNLPQSISISCWRLLHGWLPVDNKLQRKRIQLASKCQCCSECEDLLHVFWQSPKSQQIWLTLFQWFKIRIPEITSIGSLILFWNYSSMYSSPGHIRSLTPLISLWAIWEARNHYKHKNIPVSVQRVLGRIVQKVTLIGSSGQFKSKHWFGDFHLLMTWKIQIHYQRRRWKVERVTWAKPEASWFKLNTDGCLKGNPSQAAAGGIIRNSEGNHLCSFATFFGEASVIVSELTGI